MSTTCGAAWGFSPSPASGIQSEAHLREVVCSGNEEQYNWLVGWLGYCVQYPGKQAEVAVVLRGLKGTGKGMVGQMLMRLFSNHSLHITNSQASGRATSMPTWSTPCSCSSTKPSGLATSRARARSRR